MKGRVCKIQKIVKRIFASILFQIESTAFIFVSGGSTVVSFGRVQEFGRFRTIGGPFGPSLSSLSFGIFDIMLERWVSVSQLINIRIEKWRLEGYFVVPSNFVLKDRDIIYRSVTKKCRFFFRLSSDLRFLNLSHCSLDGSSFKAGLNIPSIRHVILNNNDVSSSSKKYFFAWLILQIFVSLVCGSI